MTVEPRLLLIAGPCVAESLDLCMTVADELNRLGERHPQLDIVFKASFDKANRTSIESFRGHGFDEGLALLAEVGRRSGLPVITDVHESVQAAPVAEAVDYLQIPAFLCRQTDLLMAAAATGRPVLVKKGQFLDPHNTAHITAKLRAGGCTEILLGERGTTFGYGDLVVDFRSLLVMREPGVRVVYDATHSVQQPGAAGLTSGGLREFIVPLARAAVAVGCDGLFFEVHPDPSRALSDGPNALPLDRLQEVIDGLLAIRSAAEANTIDDLEGTSDLRA
ncbi:MAG: 3-deoxy-8-phosphooctulonate synthase [Acidimicrobiia bacterium]|jgi:2-dehydro-3-deoxyphosphooctonate aldolase (KDO 8-P synthase)